MELLHHNIVVMDNRKKNPQSRPVVGDVARLDNGRVVARYRVNFQDGTSAWACGDYSLEENPSVLRNVATPKDWAAWMTAEIEKGQGSYRELGPSEFVTPGEIELAAFHKTYPLVAAFIELPMPAPRAPLVGVGRVHLPRHWQDIDWCQVLHAHDSGDFGLYGKYDDAPLTEDEIWTLAERPVITGNKAAIAAGSGPIRGRYKVSPSRIATALTVLSPGGARTLLTAHYADADLAGHP